MWSFTGISSDGYNALYTCKPLLRCRQARHFGVCCWVLTALICDCGKGTLKDLCPSLPATLTYWTLSRLVRSGQWDQDAGVEHPAHDVLRWLPPPADGVLHLSGDNTRLSGPLGTPGSPGRGSLRPMPSDGVGSRGAAEVEGSAWARLSKGLTHGSDTPGIDQATGNLFYPHGGSYK